MSKVIVKILVLPFGPKISKPSVIRPGYPYAKEIPCHPVKEVLPDHPYDEELVKIGGEYRFAYKAYDDSKN